MDENKKFLDLALMLLELSEIVCDDCPNGTYPGCKVFNGLDKKIGEPHAICIRARDMLREIDGKK